MSKLFQLLDKYLLKFLISFALFFTVVYPKLPSIHVNHTWVYIRLEDFVIGLVAVVWFIQLVRRKISIPNPSGWFLIAYWIIGAVSLGYSLLFIASHLANFFPSVAVLEYFRRIEYMILFFAAFGSIKDKKDIRDYFIVLCVTLIIVEIYGFGQRMYLSLWQIFPKFFEKYPFCFPSFQTGNEEFAKGIPLCLPGDARITSTFGGHYDLAAYLTFVVPILIAVLLALKKWLWRILVAILAISSLVLLVLTSSRTSYAAYIIGVTLMLVFLKRKKFILPVIAVSLLVLFTFSKSTVNRFLQTIRFTSIVTNNQGQIVGVAESTLPTDLRNKIAKNPVVVGVPPPDQSLPAGTQFTLLQEKAPVATTVAVLKQSLTADQQRRLKLQYGGIEISTVSGSFLIQKALVYDISFTTRFQAEWPNAWKAFMTNPPLGTGFSSITLASDNDYLRSLGETGFLGLISFMSAFLILGIALKEGNGEVKDSLQRYFLFGLAGGLIGLFLNAALIDVFEASKVAEPLWLFLGIGAGTLTLYQKKRINYLLGIKNFLTSKPLIAFYLLVSMFVFFGSSISNFFVADDFTWLRWAASSTTHDISQYFIDAQGFFYRPLDKTIMFFLYTFFSFHSEGYHLFNLILHFLSAFAVYLIGSKIFKNKLISFLSSFIFLVLPAQGENLFWISTISNNLSTTLILYGLLWFLNARDKHSIFYYILMFIFGILAFFSYEMSVVFPLIILTADIFIVDIKKKKVDWLIHIPLFLLSVVYVIVRPLLHVVPAGGDYSYSVPHFIPNFFGNLVGYLALFTLGEQSLSTYGLLRNALKVYSLPILIILIVLIAALIIGLFIKKQIVKDIYKNGKIRELLFSIFLIIFGLLPFLGLGNIAERYGYLGSVGYVLLVGLVLLYIKTLLKKYPARVFYFTVILALAIISGWFVPQLKKENKEWNNAGQITYDTLFYFRTKYPNIPSNTLLIFVNVPIRQAEAWIFPVGLTDGLWFIYRDPGIYMEQVKTVEDAHIMRNAFVSTTHGGWHIFIFDDKGNIREE